MNWANWAVRENYGFIFGGAYLRGNSKIKKYIELFSGSANKREAYFRGYGCRTTSVTSFCVYSVNYQEINNIDVTIGFEYKFVGSGVLTVSFSCS